MKKIEQFSYIVPAVAATVFLVLAVACVPKGMSELSGPWIVGATVLAHLGIVLKNQLDIRSRLSAIEKSIEGGQPKS